MSLESIHKDVAKRPFPRDPACTGKGSIAPPTAVEVENANKIVPCVYVCSVYVSVCGVCM